MSRLADSPQFPPSGVPNEGGTTPSHLNAQRQEVAVEIAARFARALNEPLAMLSASFGEIRGNASKLGRAASDPTILLTIIENASAQIACLCDLVQPSDGKTLSDRACKAIDRSIARDVRRPFSDYLDHHKLTSREREALEFIIEGCSNREGAQRMGISLRTFESHRANVMRKLGVRNAAGLVRAAVLRTGK